MATSAATIDSRLTAPGVAARGGAWVALAAGVLAAGLFNSDTAAYAITAAIYVLIGLSLNVILGYIGQMSLGHQGLMGSGALFAAYLSTAHGLPFAVDLVVAGVAGGVVAVLVGVVALRVRGLYLALVTLVVGITLQTSLFEVPSLTGGGAGEPANRPTLLLSNDRFYLVCVAVVIGALYLDTRLTGSKAGRAFLAIKEDERVAAAFGINVVGYKLLAFVLSGILAGVAGGLYAFSSEQFNGNNFSFLLALTFVLMTVVGGAGSRAGVVAGSVLFAVLQTFLANFFLFKDFTQLFPTNLSNNLLQFGPNLVAALLLLITLAVNPRGMAQQIEPVVAWMRGGPYRGADRSHAIREGISGRP
ncbi:MAG TPA: branched-chain amino acid ABC transporter permease [Acidimicrobiales bacterium]|nr:branched-chain amino acid ABC transporter permease [Acidimicrobiales bacterium]